MTDKTTEVEVLEIKTPAILIEDAVSKGADLDNVAKLLELRMKWEENESRKAYTLAVSEFKSNPPEIYKDKTNKQFDSKYTSIDALVNPAIPFLSKSGLSHSWSFGSTSNGWPTVTCTLAHKLGYSESVTMSAPPDVSGGGSKNPIQQIKSTQTYLKIATFEAVTGLVSREANLDDDGNASGIKYVDGKQIAAIKKLIKEKSADEKKFLVFMKAKTIKDISTSDYEKAIEALEAKQKVERTPGQEG